MLHYNGTCIRQPSSRPLAPPHDHTTKASHMADETEHHTLRGHPDRVIAVAVTADG